MPQALIPVLGSIGISGVAATVVSTAIYTVGAYFISDLLRPGPPKPDAAEREQKSPKPARIHVLGERRVHGSSMLFTNTSESETVDVWAYCEGPVHAVIGQYLNDDPITIYEGYVQSLPDGSYGQSEIFGVPIEDGPVLAGYNLGAIPNIAHAEVVSRVPTWTANHRGDGIVSGYLVKTGVKDSNFLDVYPQGDNVEMSLVVQGHFCHDPRNPASNPYDPATWSYTENAALILLWFKVVFKGDDYATKIAPVEDLWIAAANDCDEAIPLAGGGAEPKYRGCVLFAADADPKAIESEILAAFDGWTAEDENGCIKVYSGKVYEPTVRIGPDQIIDYEIQEFVEEENRLNEIIVRHISADHDYNEVECQPWRDDSDIAARGKIVSTTLDLQVPSHTQARRLAKRRMARTSAPQRGNARVVFSARKALAERFIRLTIEEAGVVFLDDLVEVIGGERDYETGGALIEWVAVDPNIDAWNPTTEDGEPAPTATKYYLPPMSAPSIQSAVAQVDGATSSARVAITFVAPGGSGLTWFTRWRELGDTAWLEEQQTPTGTTLITGQVPINAVIEVEIAYSSGGRFSGWSDTETVSTSTSGLAPAPPSELSVTGGTGEASISWRNPSSANLSYVKVFRNTVDDFGTADDVSGQIVGGLGQVIAITDTGLGTGEYFYWCVAYNSSNVASAPTGPQSATVT